MKDFKGKPVIVGDHVIFTDSFNRLLEGKVVGLSGKMMIVTPTTNKSGHTKTVRPCALMKIEKNDE